jgi:ribosome biogenesis SPOUT family RNA methylase Rps3
MFIIEHLDKRVWRWCVIEYRHISEIVGTNNLWFTNLKHGSKILGRYGKVIKKPVRELGLKNCCVLDPSAEKTLTPEDSRQFKYFVFGGILGDSPAKKRTKSLLTKYMKCEARNLGKRQMSTDNAVFVVKQIIEGIPLEKIKFRQGIEIQMGANESVHFPFKYALVGNKPLISKELVKYLKRRRYF